MPHNQATPPPDQARRDFFKVTLLAGLGAAACAPSGTASDGDIPDWVLAARRDLPITRESVYFQTGGIGPSPRPVINRVKELLDLQNRGPADPRFSTYLAAAEDACRPLVAELCGAAEDEVGLTHNTTEGLNVAIWSIDWKPGDELIISDQEHPALQFPTYNLARRSGVRFRIIPIGADGDIVADVLAAVSPRTRLVALSHVSRRTGRVLPARDLARALRQRGIRLLLDGAQAVGNIPVRFHELECDYYALCGHKWLLGPKGAGAVLIRRDVLETTPVSWTGAHGQKSYDDNAGRFEWLPSARRFEFGTRSQAVFGGFAAALRWMESVGWQRIHQRNAELSLRTADRIRGSDRLTLVSPHEGALRSGVVVLRLPEGQTGVEVYERLQRQHQTLVSPLDHPRDIRLSVHFFNTWDEIESTMELLEQ